MKTILVVDDESAMRRLLELTLGGPRRFRILQAGSGAEAIEIAQREPIDLALVDIGMPEMDGFALCQALRALPGDRAPRIVMVTARSAQTDRDQATALGADDYFAKPFSPIGLLDAIGRVLQTERRSAGAPTVTRAA